MRKNSVHTIESENVMVDMIGFLIGLIIARIIVAFIRNKTKNSTNISWVFRTIKMSGLKFDLMCRGIALGLVVIFYLLHLIGINKILPYTYLAFIYMEIVVLFIAPLKAEAECYLLIKEVPEEIFGYRINIESPRVDREKGCVLMSSISELYLMVMLYIRIVDYNKYKLLIVYGLLFSSILFDIIALIWRIHDDKRFKRLEAKYYEEKFRSYYRR
ncbi:MAG: hypothetical protein SOV90_09990 [Lachnospiraceae bacterium]|nr:hypothetical protein [Lachnospiraceae bacterium]